MSGCAPRQRRPGARRPIFRPRALTERFFAAVGEPVRFEASFAETLDGLAPERACASFKNCAKRGASCRGWVFASEIERNRLLQPIQESIDYLVYEAGV